MANYYVVKYDNEASGPFVEEGANLTWTGGVGFIISVIDNGTTGTLYIGLVSGTAPLDNDVLTQSTTTADAFGDGILIDYPAYFRKDVAIAGSGAITWTGPALGTTHSFFFDGQTSNVVAGEILTFSGGQTAEVVTVESDNGVDGELSVRVISNIDEGLPLDNDTFTGDIAGDGVVNGMIHDRSYKPYDEHRLLQDLNDNGDIAGDDDLSRVDPIASSKDTDQIINLLGNMNNSDEVIQHMYGGSVSQAGGDTLYSGADIQVTSPNAETQPILIQDDVIITNYWKNAYNPDSVAGNVRIMRKTRENGVDFDGKRIKGKLSEFGDSYFIGGTTLGLGTTALALFSSTDGNNQTSAATVAGAPYNSIVITEGYQLIDYVNGNGATPFGLSVDFGSANSLETYERTKYVARRGTAETLFGRDATYFDGMNLNFPYDAESANFSEDEILVWGTVMTYNTQATNLTTGEVVTFSGGSRGRLIYQDDGGATGTLIFDMNGNDLPLATETMTGLTSGGDGTLATVGTNTTAGTGTLIALDDDGTTGNMYVSVLTGTDPVDNSEIYGSTSNSNCLINGTPATRTINNQFIGTYTGTNFQTNFGIAIDSTDAIVGDILPNLLGVNQLPPNNQQGAVTSIKLGDTVTVYPWDGTSVDVNGDAEPNFDEMTLNTGLTGGVSTTVDVGTGNIPNNTPAVGFLRIQRDSDNNLDLVEYSAHNGDDTFTLVGTAPSTATAGNTTMRALVDEEATADGNLNYTAIYTAPPTKVAIKVQNGNTAAKNGPIKPFPTNAEFGAAGFSVGAVRTSDA